MKIVVIGGTGLIGSKVVAKLGEHGHEAVAASPNTGVNTLTGEGLAEVLEGADVVVDVSNSPSFEDAAVLEFFETSTSNLLAAEKAAGVGHHVALSVVGTERLADQRLLPRQGRAGGADRGAPGSRTRSCTRRSSSSSSKSIADAGDRRRHGPAAAGAVPADRRRRRRHGRRPGRGRRARERDRRGRRPGRVPHGRARPPRRCRRATTRATSSTDPDTLYFGAYKVDDSTLVPGDDALVGEIRFEDWLERRLAAA